MAGGNGFVSFPATMPSELLTLIDRYQKRMKITSRNGAVRSLIETHPAIAKMVEDLYDASSPTSGGAHGERVAST
jgi:hypothetical protein